MTQTVKPKVKIRRAQDTDLDEIYACEQACFDDPWSITTLYQDICENRSSVYLVLTHRNHVIGYCGMYIVLDEAHITNICVLPEYRNMGFATRLMDAMHNIAIERGAVAMTLEVAVSNKTALTLYHNCGFTIQGIRKKYYNGKEDAYIMWSTRQSGSEQVGQSS